MSKMPRQKPGRSKQDYETTMAVPAFPYHRADAHGNIFSTRRKGKLPKGREPTPALRKLEPVTDRDGYLRVAIVHTLGGHAIYRQVSRLVCAAFHGVPPTARHEAQHIDGVRTNNVPDNLKWGLQQENADDRERHGNTARGARQGSSKLTEEIVLSIRERVGNGELQKTIAKELGLHKSAISHIITGRNWSHI